MPARAGAILAGAAIAAGAGCGPPPRPGPAGAAPRCEVPGAPVVVRRDGAAVLERWDLEGGEVLFEPVLPADPGYAAYRAAIRQAGAELARPIADEPAIRDDAEREVWRREHRNLDVAYSGRAGAIRPIRCLEAWFFARQHARYSELEAPTEFMVSVLEQRAAGGRRLRLYFAGGDRMFPPKSVYPFADVAADVARGWTFTVMLHNHTIRRRGDRPALGVTAPSTSDVHLLRNLAAELGLGAGWITNGIYTIEIPADAFGHYVTREEDVPAAAIRRAR